MDSEALGQPVLDVPDNGVSVGRLFRQLGKLWSVGKPLAGSAVLAMREDRLIGHADRPVTRRGNKGLRRGLGGEPNRNAPKTMSRETSSRRVRSIDAMGSAPTRGFVLALQLLLHRQIDGVAVVSGSTWDFDDYAEILRCLVTISFGLLLVRPG